MDDILMAANAIACSVIFAWATWCVTSPQVRGGVLGKCVYSAIALSALAVVLGPHSGYTSPRIEELSLNCALATLGARHAFLKYVWPRVLRRLLINT